MPKAVYSHERVIDSVFVSTACGRPKLKVKRGSDVVNAENDRGRVHGVPAEADHHSPEDGGLSAAAPHLQEVRR